MRPPPNLATDSQYLGDISAIHSSQDHIIMRPPPNLATDTTPAAFAFYYMTYK